MSKTAPMAIHKNLVIHMLREHPRDLKIYMPEEDDVKIALAKLESFPGRWFVGGVLLADTDPELPEHLRTKA